MRIIPNADKVNLIVEGTPIEIIRNYCEDIIKLVYPNVVIELNKPFIYNERFVHRVGVISNLKDNNLWKIRSHQVASTYYTFGPMLITPRFSNKYLLGVNSILVNIYYAVEDINELFKLYVLIRNESSQKNYQTQMKLFNHEHFDRMLNVDDYHDIYVMNVPEEYEDVYLLILDGKYSEISDDYKNKVYKWCSNDIQKEAWRKRFEKDEKLRLYLSELLGVEIPKGNELAPPPDLEETFKKSDLVFNVLKNLPNKNLIKDD